MHLLLIRLSTITKWIPKTGRNTPHTEKATTLKRVRVCFFSGSHTVFRLDVPSTPLINA